MSGAGTLSPVRYLLYNHFWFGFPEAEAQCPDAFTLTTDASTLDRADAVLVHLPTMGSARIPLRVRTAVQRLGYRPGLPRSRRRSRQVWVGVTMESSHNFPIMDDADFMSRFDLTMTYRQDSDIPLSYLESADRASLLQPPVPKTAAAPAVYFASNPRTANRRERFVRELMRHLPVDSYGRSLNNRRLANDQGRSTKLETIARYSFTLALENSTAVDYVTEKFFEPLIAGSVPVYLGAPNVADFAPAPHSFIDVRDFSGPRDLADHLLTLHAEPESYASYLSWKREGYANPSFLAMLDRTDTPALCRLASRVGSILGQA